MCKKLIPFLCLALSSVIMAQQESDFITFFDEYQRLSSTFDASLNALYANDARIIGVRKKPDGDEEKMTISGTRWKTIILSSMERAKQLDEHSTYQNVSVTITDDQAKITASRYSNQSCFTDDRFYMIVKSVENEGLQIVEQFMQSPTQSYCDDTEAPLIEYLQTTVKMINEQLPAAVDAETQLIKTSAEGNKLIYHYVLVNYTSHTLTTEDATARLQPLVKQQSCNSPNLRAIVDQGGAISYIYRGSDAVQIVKFDIDISACTN